MKTIFRDGVVLLLVWLMVFGPGMAYADTPFPRGDVNADGAIDPLDAVDIRDRVLRRSKSAFQHGRFDFNADGLVDVADVLRVLDYDGDWDGDGVPDALDAYPTDPERSDTQPDDVDIPDDEALFDPDSGSVYATAPELEAVQLQRVDDDAVRPGGTVGDADGDGVPDATEAAQCTDRFLRDTDRDGLEDGVDPFPLEPDHDLDGYLDGTEVDAGSDPDDAGSVPAGAPDLTPSQVNALRAAGVPACGGKNAKSAGGGRGLGFQGPASVGSGFASVQSDQFTGAFSYSIPIKVPPGRNGMQPNIDLLYRSSNSHSWLGIGWDLEVGRIERSTRDGVPKYNDPANPPASDGDPMTPLDNPDTFVHKTSAGGNELIHVGELDADTEIYHAVVDGGDFTRYLFHATGNYWEAQMRDGSRMFFGGNPNTNPGTGDTNAVQQHPTEGVFGKRPVKAVLLGGRSCG